MPVQFGSWRIWPRYQITLHRCVEEEIGWRYGYTHVLEVHDPPTPNDRFVICQYHSSDVCDRFAVSRWLTLDSAIGALKHNSLFLNRNPQVLWGFMDPFWWDLSCMPWCYANQQHNPV
jgi:hypothetical protein